MYTTELSSSGLMQKFLLFFPSTSQVVFFVYRRKDFVLFAIQFFFFIFESDRVTDPPVFKISNNVAVFGCFFLSWFWKFLGVFFYSLRLFNRQMPLLQTNILADCNQYVVFSSFFIIIMDGIAVRRVIPSDNSCIFNAVG